MPRAAGRSGATRSRRSARRLALDVLYEAEIRAWLPLEAYEARRAEGWVDDHAGGEEPAPEALEYARTLIEGVQRHQADLDALIARYADHWALQRMPVIDRNLLRISLVELLWGDDVPIAVSINEAVELAKSMSTDDSGRFINGLLGRIVEDRNLR
ncbi:MAG: transcription antitermination factor NusB [Actinomycetota bacterium]